MLKKILVVVSLSASVFVSKAQKTTVVSDLKKQPSFEVQIRPGTKPPSFDLFVINPARKNLQLTISHRELGAVVDTVIKSEDFKRRFNFDEAMDGHYTITLENGKENFPGNWN